MNLFKNIVVFVRHGQTQWNLEKRSQGHLDSPLTELGVSQAIETASNLRNYKFNMIISSPLGRALKTSDIISKALGIATIQPNPMLAERHLGIFQGLTDEEIVQRFPDFFDSSGRFIEDSLIPEAETLENFMRRVKKALEELCHLSERKSVLVVTHIGVLYAVISHVRNMELEEAKRIYKIDHCKPLIL